MANSTTRNPTLVHRSITRDVVALYKHAFFFHQHALTAFAVLDYSLARFLRIVLAVCADSFSISYGTTWTLPMNGRIVLVLLSIALTSGCSLWKEEKKPKKTSFPAPVRAPDSVTIDVTFVHVPPDTEYLAEELWRDVDEQHLPTELRRRLEANGFRCGMIGSQYPEALEELIAHTENKDQIDTELGAPRVGKAIGQKRIQCRSGKLSKLITSETFPQLAVMTNDDGELRGRSCTNAHCEFSMRSFTLGDGRVRLELTPEIHHGVPKQSIVGGENAFRFDVTQERMSLDQLHIETTLSRGQTLLLTATPEANGVGGQFFRSGKSTRNHAKLLLIRLAQTQMNNLFVSDDIAAPIATPTE